MRSTAVQRGKYFRRDKYGTPRLLRPPRWKFRLASRESGRQRFCAEYPQNPPALAPPTRMGRWCAGFGIQKNRVTIRWPMRMPAAIMTACTLLNGVSSCMGFTLLVTALSYGPGFKLFSRLVQIFLEKS